MKLFRDLTLVRLNVASLNVRMAKIATLVQHHDDFGQLSMTGIPGVFFATFQWSPVAVAANTSAEQTVTVKGLKVGDVVVVNKPTAQAGLVIGGFRPSANDTLGITFGNLTGAPITPTASETYSVVAFRNV